MASGVPDPRASRRVEARKRRARRDAVVRVAQAAVLLGVVWIVGYGAFDMHLRHLVLLTALAVAITLPVWIRTGFGARIGLVAGRLTKALAIVALAVASLGVLAFILLHALASSLPEPSDVPATRLRLTLEDHRGQSDPGKWYVRLVLVGDGTRYWSGGTALRPPTYELFDRQRIVLFTRTCEPWPNCSTYGPVRNVCSMTLAPHDRAGETLHVVYRLDDEGCDLDWRR